MDGNHKHWKFDVLKLSKANVVCMCKSTKYLQENEKHLHVFVLPGYDGNIFLSAHV